MIDLDGQNISVLRSKLNSEETLGKIFTLFLIVFFLSTEVRILFLVRMTRSAGLAINERLNDCEGLLAALKAGEEASAITV